MTLLTGLTLSEWRIYTKLCTDDAKTLLTDFFSYLPAEDEAWIYRASREQILHQLDFLIPAFHDKPESLPLFGIPFAVKDNIDVADWPTTAACPAFSYIASSDASAVARLKAAGAIVVGKTNLDQFATGLVGVRSPYGAVKNSFRPEFVSGGSSSGSASVVARGLVPFALGTDTAGSGRVPAGFNNIVGLKPTKGWLSAKGVVPACRLNDTISVFALTVEDAFTIATIAGALDSEDSYSRINPGTAPALISEAPVFAIPDQLKFFGDIQAESAWQAALKEIKALGVTLKKINFSSFYKLAEELYQGPWVAERTAAVGDMLNHPEDMDQIVYGIVSGGMKFSAVEAWNAEYQRASLARQINSALAEVDVLLVPTSPTIHTLEEIKQEPVRFNSEFGTYTNFTNLADLSALALPATFRADGLPAGITLIAPAWHDRALANFGLRWQQHMALPLGATKRSQPSVHTPLPPSFEHVRFAIVGTYSTGMPLNFQLTTRQAVFIEETTTAPCYRLFALLNGPVKTAGLMRSKNSNTITVELWDIPLARFGEFVAEIPPPLGIGSLTLADGRVVKGIICEEAALSNALEITETGCWRNWLSTQGRRGKMFNTVLIANRGEIARRAIRTLKRLGVKSVAVYSDADRNALHVKDADVAIALGGDKASDSYVRIDKILVAAQESGAEAIWPGYGFLSESVAFVDACEKAGIVFVGPTACQIGEFGLKHRARKLAAEAGVPIIPGTSLLATLEKALKAAEQIGYPVMLKSTAGGGGIGLRRCANAAALRNAWESVRRLGEEFFNDTGVFLERCINRARHIEVQIFGDGNGRVVALGERDCSLQRRNQKVVEETPASNLPQTTREALIASAVRLGELVNYRSAGTIEYIYDAEQDAFYFLEVNARLQVEHPVTECVTGLDLVAYMLRVAAGDTIDWPRLQQEPQGVSVEVRLYAENPLKNFRPSSGTLTQVTFPDGVRIDSGVTTGSEVSPWYDPMVAKLIVHADTREEAIQTLQAALSATQLHGIVTNLDYLRKIVDTEVFLSGNVWTSFLDSFTAASTVIEVLQPGTFSTVQDYPGRLGYWDIGIPPSGPMDDLAFRLANKIVGNDEAATGLEFTLLGPTLCFHSDAVIALTGADCLANLNGTTIDYWRPITVKAGQTLTLGRAQRGCRTYLAVRNGFDVPKYLGSRSTFSLGQFSGHAGRTLHVNDMLSISQPQLAACTTLAPVGEPQVLDGALLPEYDSTWHISVLYGPHGAPDFFTQAAIDEFFVSDWQVHYNSNRLGVRLVGPKPTWARANGGEAGLHPSNVHDYAYAIGAINFTGDSPVILTHDGPSLGGFVCPVTIAKAELWKVGQLKPGDRIRFHLISADEAVGMEKAQAHIIKTLRPAHAAAFPVPSLAKTELGSATLLAALPASTYTPKAVYRQAGDNYILIEYGENVLDLSLRLRVHLLMNAVRERDVLGVEELLPGVCSLQVRYDSRLLSQSALIALLLELENILGNVSQLKVPSRIVWMPMAFEDSAVLCAVKRYKETVRADAPWLPNNVDFLQRINGLSSREAVHDILFNASYLVLGLGDVYLGAPCAVPVDPRHRLLSSKYNPARTFTAEGTVGIGGIYMCIYGMDSPGGYQLVGRTLPIWNRFLQNPQFTNGKPWLLRFFDQVRFYPVSEAKLTQLREDFHAGRITIRIEETQFDFAEHQRFLAENFESIEAFRHRQAAAFKQEVALWAEAEQNTIESPDTIAQEVIEDQGAIAVQADMNGQIWKVLVQPGDEVKSGQMLVIIEAMKMELKIMASHAGRVKRVVCHVGCPVSYGDTLLWLE